MKQRQPQHAYKANTEGAGRHLDHILAWSILTITVTLAAKPMAGETENRAWSEGIGFAPPAASAGNAPDPCDQPFGDSLGFVSLAWCLRFNQSDATTAVPDPSQPAIFYNYVFNPTNNPLAAATLEVPGGTTMALSNLGPGVPLGAVALCPSQEALRAQCPPGLYRLAGKRSDGTVFNAAIAVADFAYPPRPELLNWADAQKINPAADLLLKWSAFPNASSNDLVAISVSQNGTPIWSAPDPCQQHLLTNNNTAVLIPRHALGAHSTYEVSLSFVRLMAPDFTSLPGFALQPQANSSLNFTIQTTDGQPAIAPRFTRSVPQPNNTLLLEIQGEPLTVWRLERASDLGGWTLEALVTILPSGTATQSVPLSGSRGFFRLVSN
jgi:hypothetical protein